MRGRVGGKGSDSKLELAEGQNSEESEVERLRDRGILRKGRIEVM